MNKSKLIALIVIVIVVVGGFLILRPTTSDAPVDEPNNTGTETENEVTRPADGEAPDEDMVEIPEDAVVYTVNTNESTLTWSSSRIVGSDHTGTVPINEGLIVNEQDRFTGGQFTLDIINFTENKNNERFMNHVRSADFFDVEQFPTAEFVITDMIPNGESDGNVFNVRVTGDLEIKGITNEIQFPATLELTDGTVKATASFTIDRTRWGIEFDSGSIFTDLGDRAIEDDIEFDLDLIASIL